MIPALSPWAEGKEFFIFALSPGERVAREASRVRGVFVLRGVAKRLDNYPPASAFRDSLSKC